MIGDIQKVQYELENLYQEQVKDIDNEALELYNSGKETKMIDFLTDFAAISAENTVTRWKELDNFLLVKYLDSNIKQEENGEFLRNGHGYPVKQKQPGYPDSWKKKFIEETGDRFER